MNQKKTLRLLLGAAIVAAVSIPLVSQVRKAQSAARASVQLAQAQTASPEAPAPAPKPVDVDPSKVILTQGDITVTAGEFNAVAATLPQQYQAAMSDPAIKKRIANQIVQVKQLAAEARRRGVQNSDGVKQQIQMQTDELLVNALAKDIQNGENEKDERAYFDAHRSNFDNVKARHILIRTPGSPVPLDAGQKELTDAQAKAKADAIEKRLAKGEDFAALAKAESDDKGSGLKGGDLGTFAPWKMDATFSKAALALKKNQVSEPIKTQFGYHIIQLLDDTPRSYEDAKSEVGEARWSSLVSSLKTKAEPDYDRAFFGTAPETAPATQPTAAHAPAGL